MRIFKHLFKKKQESKDLMDYFSIEYRNKLINEHRLISTSVAHLSQHAAQKARVHGHDAVAAAINNQMAKKVELEGMIDVLTEFLEK